MCENPFGFEQVHVHAHCYIIGHTGVMLVGSAATLTALGVLGVTAQLPTE